MPVTTRVTASAGQVQVVDIERKIDEMMPAPRLRRSRAAAVSSLAVVTLAAGIRGGQDRPITGTTTFVLDGNRMYAEVGFIRRDRAIHRALAFVDMGSQFLTVRESLFNELQLGRDRSLSFRVGELLVEIPRTDVMSEPRAPSPLGAELKVEATLPASVLQRYQVVLDYQARTLALAPRGTLTPDGVSIPFRINSGTGLIVVDATLDGKSFAMTIDNGSAYTWVTQRSARDWLTSHPEWERGVGAVGTSNMTMSGDGSEAAGTLLRIPEVSIGGLVLKQVGVFAAARGRNVSGNLDLFDWYSQKNAEPVIGWIGGNVLKAFRLTLDYPRRMSYWFAEAAIDQRDLDQVGLTLRSSRGEFFVSGIATKNGHATVQGIRPGDKLIRVGDLELSKAIWGQVFEAMHGSPGESRSLLVERDGARRTIRTTVTAF